MSTQMLTLEEGIKWLSKQQTTRNEMKFVKSFQSYLARMIAFKVKSMSCVLVKKHSLLLISSLAKKPNLIFVYTDVAHRRTGAVHDYLAQLPSLRATASSRGSVLLFQKLGLHPIENQEKTGDIVVSSVAPAAPLAWEQAIAEFQRMHFTDYAWRACPERIFHLPYALWHQHGYYSIDVDDMWKEYDDNGVKLRGRAANNRPYNTKKLLAERPGVYFVYDERLGMRLTYNAQHQLVARLVEMRENP